ncbi:hypothetical protein [Nonomuraea recticatena]|uniref:hypothetical protein n=1 Tax=Nonomuraea recticatena TaxID=46178 RepID=UPI003609EF7E
MPSTSRTSGGTGASTLGSNPASASPSPSAEATNRALPKGSPTAISRPPSSAKASRRAVHSSSRAVSAGRMITPYDSVDTFSRPSSTTARSRESSSITSASRPSRSRAPGTVWNQAMSPTRSL